MAKILLVEDDNNLREIYEARLMAEGYDIVAARDGEEALTVAMKEKPDLIISDVMMPKISGFDMLDILRSTKETKDAKVIMMTALSQAEDKARAEKLGADRYLVKSQVTLEDVAKVAKEVLEDTNSGTQAVKAAAPVAVATGVAATPAPPQAQSVAAAPEPAPEPATQDASVAADPQPKPAEPAAQPTPAVATTQQPPVADPAPVQPAPDPQSASAADDTTTVQQTTGPQEGSDESSRRKTIAPINDLTEDSESKLKELLEKEKVKEDMAQGVQETVAKHTATPTVVPSETADVSTPEAPVQPPAPESTVDPSSIAL